MPTVTLERAQRELPELIDALRPGEALVITRNERPVAELFAPKRQPRKAGNCIGMLVVKADDEEHLADFAEYLE